MNALLIENHYLAGRITRDISNVELFLTDEYNSVETLADAIPDNYDIYIIHANVQIGNGTGAANLGIKLLKLLRLRHNNNHVIVYSWLDKDALMEQDIRNAILFTKGVSFYKLPDFLDIARSIDLGTLSKITADRQELIQVFRAEYDPDDRHFNANIIGAWQLMRVQDAYEEISGTPSETSNSEDQDTDYDKSRKQILTYLNTYNGRLVQYLGNYCSVESMKAVLRDEIIAHNREAILDAGKQAINAIEGIDRTISDIDSQIKIIQNLSILEQKSSEQQGLLNSMLRFFDIINNRVEQKLNERVHNSIAQMESQKEVLIQEKQHWLLKQKRMEALCKDPHALAESALDKKNMSRLEEITSTLKTSKPRVIYVDDLAEEGWASVLRRMIYGNSTKDYEKLTAICPKKEDNTESIIQNIRNANVYDADLLILDLRLKDERGFVDPNKLSGYQVLQKLGKMNLTCPILVFTASNKVWSLKGVFKDNVVSYYVKAGMEKYDSEKAIVNNYINLVDQIYFLTSTKWIFDLLSVVKKMSRAMEDAKSCSFWWEIQDATFQDNFLKKHPDQPKRNHTNRNDVIRILNRVVSITQNNLRQCYFGMYHMSFADVFRMFLIELHFALEEIARFRETEEDTLGLSKTLNECAKQYGIIATLSLLRTRNDIVHNGLVPLEKDLRNYLYGLFTWIMATPPKQRTDMLNNNQPIFVEVGTIKQSGDSVSINYYDPDYPLNIFQSVIVEKSSEIAQKVVAGDFVMIIQNNDGKEPTREILDYYKIKQIHPTA